MAAAFSSASLASASALASATISGVYLTRNRRLAHLDDGGGTRRCGDIVIAHRTTGQLLLAMSQDEVNSWCPWG